MAVVESRLTAKKTRRHRGNCRRWKRLIASGEMACAEVYRVYSQRVRDRRTGCVARILLHRSITLPVQFGCGRSVLRLAAGAARANGPGSTHLSSAALTGVSKLPRTKGSSSQILKKALVYRRGRSCFIPRCAIRWRVATVMLLHHSQVVGEAHCPVLTRSSMQRNSRSWSPILDLIAKRLVSDSDQPSGGSVNTCCVALS